MAKNQKWIAIILSVVCVMSLVWQMELKKTPPKVGAANDPSPGIQYTDIAGWLASGTGIAAVLTFLKNNQESIKGVVDTAGKILHPGTPAPSTVAPEFVASAVALASGQTDAPTQWRYVNAQMSMMGQLLKGKDVKTALGQLAVAIAKDQYPTDSLKE